VFGDFRVAAEQIALRGSSPEILLNEEIRAFSRYGAEIVKAADEYWVRMVMAENFDAAYEEFMRELRARNIDAVVAERQAYFERHHR
jgi:hypothetical protein